MAAAKKNKTKKTAAWKKTANMTPAQKKSYNAALRKVRKLEEREAKVKAAKKAALAAAAEETKSKSNTQPKVSGFRALLFYWLIFFASIVFWELYLGILSQKSLEGMQYWFLLFAVPQSLLFAALCGWWRDRFDRVVASILLIAVFVFYVSQFIYYRTFGSMISMSMLGVGGDALENFGWAVMVTVKESIGLLILFALPVLAAIVWIFVRRPRAGRFRPLMHLAALAFVVLLWLPASLALRLGGTDDTSAYNAYVSSLVDTDTASAKLGVLTTSMLELRSGSAAEEYEDEIADTFDALVSEEEVVLPVNIVTPELSSLGESDKTQTADSPEAEDLLVTEDQPVTEDLPVTEELPDTNEISVDRSPNIIDAIDFEYLSSVADKATIKNLCDYFASSSGTNKNDYTGMLAGYNLIFICAESFCNSAVDEQITPTLYRMANEGIVLENFYNSYKNTTTNGEFSFMTGLWPDVSRQADKGVTTGSFGQSSKNYMPYGLGNVFKDLGVNSYAFHNYYGDYYGRATTHKNLGFKCKFMGQMKFSSTWPSSDYEMMLQSVDDYIDQDRFNAYYMTFSGHGPYTEKNAICKQNLSLIPKTLNGRKLDNGARCYLACNLELDKAMEYLLERLEKAGKLDNTLIVLVGDHYPYYLSDTSAKALLGELPESNFERYHSTCIMWYKSSEPIKCDTPCCNVDILPTVLNLLGIEYDSRLLSGTDIFSDSLHAAMLYNKSFITDSVKYNASNGKTTWLIDTEDYDETELKTYVDNVYSLLKGRYAAALSVNKLNFYKFVWANTDFPEEAEPDMPEVSMISEQPSEEEIEETKEDTPIANIEHSVQATRG